MSFDLRALAEPFDPRKVSWRVGSVTKKKDKAMPLAYLTSRDIMDRLDEVVGPENWQTKIEQTSQGVFICQMGINIPSTGWVWKTDVSGETQIEGEKGGSSGSIKRAAVSWGIGRYLYGIHVGWTPIDEWKRFSDSTLAQLAKKLPRPASVTPMSKRLTTISKRLATPDSGEVETVKLLAIFEKQSKTESEVEFIALANEFMNSDSLTIESEIPRSKANSFFSTKLK